MKTINIDILIHKIYKYKIIIYLLLKITTKLMIKLLLLWEMKVTNNLTFFIFYF